MSALSLHHVYQRFVKNEALPLPSHNLIQNFDYSFFSINFNIWPWDVEKFNFCPIFAVHLHIMYTNVSYNYVMKMASPKTHVTHFIFATCLSRYIQPNKFHVRRKIHCAFSHLMLCHKICKRINLIHFMDAAYGSLLCVSVHVFFFFFLWAWNYVSSMATTSCRRPLSLLLFILIIPIIPIIISLHMRIAIFACIE